LSRGSVIFIPLNKNILVKDLYKRNSKRTKVFYKVGQKETLFRIAKVNLDMSVEELMKLNKIKNTDLNLGQLLFVGYLASDERNQELVNNILPHSGDKTIKPLSREKAITFDKVVLNDVSFQNSKAKKVKEPALRKAKKSKSDTDPNENIVVSSKKQQEDRTSETIPLKEKKARLKNDEKEKLEFVGVISRPVSESGQSENVGQEHILKSHKDSGIALWNKQSRVKGVYVLSNDAALNTMIEINNPMVQRKIFAKVIGNIPTNTYPDNVKVVLSPEAAMTLGALDSRFFVKLHYLK
jgi:hypothetical protein